MEEIAAMEKSADAFRTISEVADELRVPQHVLRFWETRFPQIRPLKRAGGRRYYRPTDTILLRAIRQLLYDEGYTIKGVQRLLKEQGVRRLAAGAGSTSLERGGADPVTKADPAGGSSSPIEPSLEPIELPDSEPMMWEAPDVDAASSFAAARRPVLATDTLREALALVEECLGILQTVR